jgi:hypothetical protein
VPLGGLTITPGAIPSCHVTLDPAAAAPLPSAYSDTGTATIASVSVPVSGTAPCSGTSSTLTLSATLVLSPVITNVS